jgi:hypothetical protein
MRSVGLDFAILEKTRKLDVDANADLAWLDYVDDSFDSEIIGNFEGRAYVDLIPQRLLWSFQDNFGQGRIDPVAVSSPANRENINYLTTGPDLIFGLSSATHMLLSGRYSNVSYEDSPVDNSRILGLVGLIRDLAADNTLSLNVQAESIDFDDPANIDYDRNQAYMRYEAAGGRTRLAVDAGYSRLKRLDTSDNSIIARLELSRRVSRSSSIVFAAGRDDSDAANGLRWTQALTPPGLDPQPTLQTSAPFTATYGSLEWNFSRRRTEAGLSISQFDESYTQLDIQDRIRRIARVGLSRDIARTMRVAFQGSYSKEDFKELVGDFNETSASVVLTREFGRRLSVNLQYQYFKRGSELPGTEFDENRGWLYVSYGRTAERASNSLPALPSDSGP